MAKVMIVEDDPFARKLMRDSLSLSGEDHEVFDTDKGKLALDVIAVERPDVVLLDVNMPQLGGIPILTEIRGNPATAHVRIIIVSAYSGSDFIAECLSAGASDYIVKPFQPSDLARRVRRALSEPVVA
jgi:CheY-like chemotaxis protein